MKLGAKRIVVLPYFLFTGILPDRVRQQTEGWAAAHPEVEVRSADVIGPEPELLDLVMERYQEAVKGDIRMNCDSCVYRIALPGFEDKVGLPQQPHFHPDDDDHHHGIGHGHHHGACHSHCPLRRARPAAPRGCRGPGRRRALTDLAVNVRADTPPAGCGSGSPPR